MADILREFDVKRERLARLCRERDLAGIVLTTQANFAWLSGGGLNRIDGSREPGAGALLAGADGRVHVLANAIEMPRLAGEELAHLSLPGVEYPWIEDHATPGVLGRLAARVLGAGARIGADWPMPGAADVGGDVARARTPLTTGEVERYRRLGGEAGRATEAACRALTPGLTEIEIARRVNDAVAGVGARSVVLLVGVDERLARFRHPVPTAAPFRQRALVAVCAQREGLIVSLTRIVSAVAVDPELAARTRAAASVFGALLDATRDGATGGRLYEVAAAAYAGAGFPHEEQKHHQGGATGYRSREWLAYPGSDDRVRPPQAFGWNPSITGTKVEDTALITDEGVELVTSTGGWPSIPVQAGGRTLAAADILTL